MSFSTPVFRPQKFMPIFRSGGGNKTQHYMFTRKQKLCRQSFLKSISNSHFTLSFLFSWNWNDDHIDTQPYLLHKPYPIPHQNEQSLYPFSDQNGAKTLPYPPPPPRKILALLLSTTFCILLHVDWIQKTYDAGMNRLLGCFSLHVNSPSVLSSFFTLDSSTLN